MTVVEPTEEHGVVWRIPRELRNDVDRHTYELVTNGCEWLRARRISIETALTERSLLNINQGGWR